MPRTSLIPVAALAALALAACDRSPTAGADAGLDSAEAQQLAAAWAGVGAAEAQPAGPLGSVEAAEGPALATSTTEFTRTRQCPVSGTATLQGTRVEQRDPATRTGSMQMNATRTDAACTMTARRGGGTISITSTPNVALTASHSWANGVPGVHTSTHKGSFTWQRSGGQSGACTVDITRTFDPATRTETVKGTFCNHSVDVTRTHTP